MKEYRDTLAVDFDGVVHRYSKGWQGGVCYDDPMPGTKQALLELSRRYRLVLFTARTNLNDVEHWLLEHGMLHLFKEVTNTKPQAKYYLDDRAVRFTDWDQALEDLR